VIALPERWVRVGVAVWPMLGLLALTYAVLLWRFDLPDPVATHFEFTGDPDSSLDRNAFFSVLLAVAGFGTGAAMVASWRCHSRAVLSGWSSAATFAAWLAAAIGIWTLLSQRGLESWTDARGPTMPALLVVIAVPTLGATLASALGLRLPVPPLTWDSAPRMGLAPDEDAVWTQRVVAPWFVLPVMYGLGLVAGGWLAGFGIFIWMGALLCIVGAQMRSLRVTTDRNGLTLAWGPLGLPRQSVPLAEIAQATAIDVRPRDWGGWGYRGSMLINGQAGAILRAGPGLHLNLVDGRVFVVTVDDPEIGAGLLNDYVLRAAGGDPPSAGRMG